MELAEVAANRIGEFVYARVQSVKIPASAMHEAWKAARDQFSWRVDLGRFKDAQKYPGFFDRVIEPGQIVHFEDTFRAALAPNGHVERAAEVVFWKNGANFKARDRITRDLMLWIYSPELWLKFVEALQELARAPSWESYQRFIMYNGQTSGFATPLTFLSFYDPKKFPMVDKRIGKWWSQRFSGRPQFTWDTKGALIKPTKKSFEAYLSWTEFCQLHAAYLSTLGERDWRARDVEMAVWTDVDARLPLDV
jgi:hypothetical protein